ncbi:MAG: hypothetical protein ED557_15705 [Balneola sp.]|nr:MAG: hypothetical protein ED557_15705 [Balneola sp.]
MVLIKIDNKMVKMDWPSKLGVEIFYCVAWEFGFANEHSLYKFVKRHTGKIITELKRDSEKGQ